MNDGDVRDRALRTVASVAADIATYCDHAEHVEPADAGIIGNAALRLCEAAISLAEAGRADLIDRYAIRMAEIEARSPLPEPQEGANRIRASSTWRDLQAAQAEHDRAFHPDVLGLARADQLRHYALHLAKFPAAILEADSADFAERRLPDMLLFAIKLWTLSGAGLPESDFQGPEGLTAPE